MFVLFFLTSNKNSLEFIFSFCFFPGTKHEADYNLVSKFFTWGIQPLKLVAWPYV